MRRRVGIRAGTVTWAALAAVLLAAALDARAETPVPLPDNLPEAATELATEGRAPGSKSLEMQVYLAPRNHAQLNRLLEALQDPASPHYHRWLSAAEYERRFAPTRRDVDIVAA